MNKEKERKKKLSEQYDNTMPKIFNFDYITK